MLIQEPRFESRHLGSRVPGAVCCPASPSCPWDNPLPRSNEMELDRPSFQQSSESWTTFHLLAINLYGDEGWKDNLLCTMETNTDFSLVALVSSCGSISCWFQALAMLFNLDSWFPHVSVIQTTLGSPLQHLFSRQGITVDHLLGSLTEGQRTNTVWNLDQQFLKKKI